MVAFYQVAKVKRECMGLTQEQFAKIVSVLKDFAEIREMIDCLDNGQVSASALRQTANNLELLVLNMSHRIKTLCDENYELETAREVLECELKKVKGE